MYQVLNNVDSKIRIITIITYYASNEVMWQMCQIKLQELKVGISLTGSFSGEKSYVIAYGIGVMCGEGDKREREAEHRASPRDELKLGPVGTVRAGTHFILIIPITSYCILRMEHYWINLQLKSLQSQHPIDSSKRNI